MAERLSTDTGLVLLQNTIATGAVLVAIILAFGALSGAHFNPAVTLSERALGNISTNDALAYLGAQFVGGVVGVVCANLMFDLSAVNWSNKQRSDGNLIFADGIATLGLLLIIAGVVRSGRANSVAYAVAAYITAAYYFTSSTSFANPAVTVARMLSNTFAGIKPSSAPAFIGAQLVGTVVAIGLIRYLWPTPLPPQHHTNS